MFNREKLLEVYFDLIKESMEWADDMPGNFYDYINGVTDMTDMLLRKLEEENKNA